MGRSTWRDASPDVGLVVADPDELRRGEPGQRVVAGDRDQPLRSDRPADRVALGGGPLVVPQDRRPEDLAAGVEQDARRASGRSARRPRCRSPATPVEARTERIAVDGAVPPQPRILLAPERARHVEAVLGGADAADRSPSRRSGRPWSPSSRRRSRGRGPPGQRPAPVSTRARLGRRPDRLVHDVLEQLLPAGHRLRVDLARGDPAVEDLERTRRPTGSIGRARPPSPRSAPRASRSSVAALDHRRPPRAATGRACRCRRCGRGRGRSGPGSGGAASCRS